MHSCNGACLQLQGVQTSGECAARVLSTSASLSSLSASTCTRPQALGAALCGRQRLFSPASSCSPATGCRNCRGGRVPAGAPISSSSGAAPASAASWRLVRCASLRVANLHGHPCGLQPRRTVTHSRPRRAAQSPYARVTVTDLASQQPLLEKNIAANTPALVAAGCHPPVFHVLVCSVASLLSHTTSST